MKNEQTIHCYLDRNILLFTLEGNSRSYLKSLDLTSSSRLKTNSLIFIGSCTVFLASLSGFLMPTLSKIFVFCQECCSVMNVEVY